MPIIRDISMITTEATDQISNMNYVKATVLS